MSKAYIVSVFCVAVLWIPFASWMFHKYFDAPTFTADPAWYISSAFMSVVVAILFEYIKNWMAKK